jgi:choice-of-anchor B domain-containing protein
MNWNKNRINGDLPYWINMKKQLRFAASLAASLWMLTCGLLQAQTPCENGFAGIYPCENMDLLAHLTSAEIGGGESTNDIWGWVSPATGKEYALVGCSNGTAFVDVTEPTEPIYLGLLPTHTTNSLWRDLETYKDYVFVGSEAGGHGLQIMDLMQLDLVTNPPVQFVETMHYGGFGNSHTINIDPVSGLLVAMGTSTFNGGLHIIDINDPLSPVLVGGFADDGYTHDGFITTYTGPDADYIGKTIVVACNADALTLVDITNPLDCQMIDTYSYPELGYVHQGWFSKNNRYFMLNDELDEMNLGNGTRTHMFDLLDLDNIVYMGFHEANNTSIDHNLYTVDQFIYQSNYRSGLRVFDAVRVSDAQLSPIGFFDLVPTDDNPTFAGTWSNYPYLPSGINLATSMYDGFFITRPTMVTFSEKEFALCGESQITFDVSIQAELAFPLTFGIEGLPGVSINSITATQPGVFQVILGNLNGLAAGSYTGRVTMNTTFGEKYEFPIYITASSTASAAPVMVFPFLGSPDFIFEGDDLLTVDWLEVPGSLNYTVQIATDADFNNIVDEALVVEDTYSMSSFLPLGLYYVRVRANTACGVSPWTTVDEVDVVITQVEELDSVSIGLYPNPGSGFFTITSDRELSLPVQLFDSTGRMLRQQWMNGKTAEWRTEDLPRGMYLIRVGTFHRYWIKN